MRFILVSPAGQRGHRTAEVLCTACLLHRTPRTAAEKTGSSNTVGIIHRRPVALAPHEVARVRRSRGSNYLLSKRQALFCEGARALNTVL